MKGLLLKDLYMVRNGCLYFVFMIGIFSAFTFLPNDRTYVFFSVYSIILSSMLTITLIAYDEKSKWDIYCDTLPYPRKTTVSEKYVFTYLTVAAVWMISSLARLLNLSLNGTLILGEYFTYIGMLLVLGIIYPAIMLPAIFKFGAQKGRLINIITMIIAFSSAYGLYANLMNIKIILIVTAVIAIAAIPLSWLLSVKFYEQREF